MGRIVEGTDYTNYMYIILYIYIYYIYIHRHIWQYMVWSHIPRTSKNYAVFPRRNSTSCKLRVQQWEIRHHLKSTPSQIHIQGPAAYQSEPAKLHFLCSVKESLGPCDGGTHYPIATKYSAAFCIDISPGSRSHWGTMVYHSILWRIPYKVITCGMMIMMIMMACQMSSPFAAKIEAGWATAIGAGTTGSRTDLHDYGFVEEKDMGPALARFVGSWQNHATTPDSWSSVWAIRWAVHQHRIFATLEVS